MSLKTASLLSNVQSLILVLVVHRFSNINISKWTKAEERELLKLVGSYGSNEPDWAEVAVKLDSSRTPIQVVLSRFSKIEHW